MSDRIRGGRPPATPELPRKEEAPADGASKGAPATSASSHASDNNSAQSVDKFERSTKVGAQLESRLHSLAGKTTGKIVFSNEDIAYLATTFAALLAQHPQANRKKRAHLFAKAILKRKRLKKAFSGVPEQEMEQMCDIIGDVLDSSPVFGQLVDNVTEEASKLNSGS